MFPFHENTSEWDEYGEVINPDDFVMQEDDAMDVSLAHVSEV
jgi:cleavage and polyadenylation specificity factor subunit 2